MNDRNRLLIVDDEPAIREYFRDVAEDMGYAVVEAGDRAEFVARYDQFMPTAVILDLSMPDADGVELLRELADRDCAASVLLASGQDKRVLATAQRVGENLGLSMEQALQKPIRVADLQEVLNRVRLDPPTVPRSTLRHDRSAGLTSTREELERAIDAGELVLHFQPKVSLRHDDRFPVIGGEALVRWDHPQRGLISPADFVALAEETGLIGSLTETVVMQAVVQLRNWQKNGLALPVSVNLSPRQLTDLTLPDRIARLLNDAGLDPKLLIVEITEQAAMADIGKATDILTRLRLKNIAVSLDDFGAGYSSLVEIYRMPLSELKFDRSLIIDIDHDPDAQTVVKALVGLAHALSLPVCAEGIETPQTAQFLQSIGCDTAQGFYFSKPLPARDFLNFALSHGTMTVVESREEAQALERLPYPPLRAP